MTDRIDARKLADELAALGEKLAALGGCSDGNCCILKPIGMHTNGGCRCVYHTRNDDAQRRKIEKVLRSYQIALANLPAIIDALREGEKMRAALKHIASMATYIDGDDDAIRIARAALGLDE